MPFDPVLAERIRACLAGEEQVSETRMMGGLGFLVGGKLAVSASGQGGLLVRVPPGDSAALLRQPHVRPAIMRGREVRGWVRVDEAVIRSDGALRAWVDRGVACARSLPSKG